MAELGREEVLVPLPCPAAQVPLVSQVRGSMLVGAWGPLREEGLEERYWAALAPRSVSALRALVSQEWLPVEAALDHYEAIESLGFSEEKARRNGARNMERVQGSYVGTVLRGLGALGVVSPFTLLARSAAARDRLVRGGAMTVVRTGEREARLENHGDPFAHLRYNSAAYEGFVEASLVLVARNPVVRRLPQRGKHVSAFAVRWE